MTTEFQLPDDRIRISSPTFGPDVEAAVLAVLRSGHIAQGPVVAKLEELTAAMAGAAFAVAMSNGTAALESALEVLGVGENDEIITSPFTFAATLNAILRAGATARFADIAPDYTVSPASVEALVGERTRVLLPVHLYGLMADMDALEPIAKREGLWMVEDAAQAHGARQGDRRAGATGLGCFSFYATKNVTSAEGGAVTTSDADLAYRLRLLRNQGMEAKYDYLAVGRNSRLTDLAAAVAVPQMRCLDESNRIRSRNAKELTSLLINDMGIALPVTPEGRSHVWHQYTVLLPPAVDRASVIAGLAERGVGAGVYYPRLVWDYPPFRTHPRVRKDATPRAAFAAGHCLSLPVHPGLRAGDLERIAGGLKEVVASLLTGGG